MSIRSIRLGGLSALALAAAAISSQALAADTVHRVDLGALNGSGVTGQATVRLSQDRRTLTVMINARGLEPGKVHIAHIHGPVSPSGDPVNSVVPTRAQDSDGDGFIELDEGGTTYGPIIVDFGNIDPDGDGRVSYRQSFDLTDKSTFAAGFDLRSLVGRDFTMLDFREIVVHGLTVPPGPGQGTPGEVDGTNGYLVVLPVAAGEINDVGGGRR